MPTSDHVHFRGMQPRLQSIQDWSNRHLFTSSLDYWNQEPPATETFSVQNTNYGSTHGNDSIPEEDGPVEDAPPDDPHAGTGEKITALQAAWNVTNAIQGMFIVGLPIAVKVGGWWSVGAMVGVAYICYWTGLLLIDCLYEGDKKVRHSYREVAEFYRPGFGKWVLAAQLTELLSTCIIYLVLAADLLQSCFPSIDKPAWMMLVAAILLACALLDSLILVSQLSFANAVSHLIVNAIMLIYCLSEIRNWSLGSVTFRLDIQTLPTMIGVVVFGYTSHIFLPSLEGSMQNPKEFKWMLGWSHIAAAAFKAIFGLFGYLTFADLTQQEISNSLPNQGFKAVVNLVLVVKALLSYPLPFYAAVQLLKDNLFRGTKVTPFTGCYSPDGSLREWALFLRILLLIFTLFIALSVPYLIELMGLIGNITGNKTRYGVITNFINKTTLVNGLICVLALENSGNASTSSSFSFNESAAVLIELQLSHGDLRRVDSDMHSRSIGLLAGNFVDVDDEFLTIASDDTATVSPMTTTGNDNFIIDSDGNSTNSMFSAELLGKRRRHYSSALVGRSIEMLFAVLARVSGDESVEFHLGTLKV